MDISTILIVVLVVVCIGLIGLTVWLFLRKKEAENLIKHKEIKYKNLTKRWDSAKEDIRNLNSQLAVAMDKIAIHQTELTIANRGIGSLHNRLVIANNEITNLDSQLAVAMDKIAIHQTELMIANHGIMNLHGRLVTANNEITNLDSQLAAAMDKIAIYQTELMIANHGIMNLHGRLVTANNEITSLDSQLAIASGKIAIHQTELTIANHGIMNLHGRLVTANNEITNLDSQLAVAMDKIAIHQIELTIANDGIMNFYGRLVIANIRIANLKTELTTTIKQRREVSQSNANAVRRLHVSQISLQSSVVAFYNEQKKYKQLIESYQSLEQMYNNLSKTYNTSVEKSKRKAKWALGIAIVKAGLDFLPIVGTVVNLASRLIQWLMDSGEVAAESSDIIAAAESLTDVITNLEDLKPISIPLPDQDIDSISIALTEEGQRAFKDAFEQHLMDTEKLELSNLTDFTTDAHRHAEDLDLVKSMTEDEHYERTCIIFDNLVDLGFSYYDYHKAHKEQLAEKAPDLSY